ncbi:putative phage tail fiber protein [Candidatus Termititenax aidoneus]|uniref:Phage tail fiber protein n=1 Tax=Termititenax aidoneus TaxID=2218524 RepID=A0A388T7V4_TERA1|nr:putative phage tail fiber protein [Candidatus Termititenax aidoneus]
MTIARGEPLLASDILNLTFFPKGTILTFSSTAWSAASADFKTIWKICDGTSNTPNLIGRFLRGGSSSDFITGGGADSQSVTLTSAYLPEHAHAVTELPLTGLSMTSFSIENGGAHGHTGSSATTSTSGGAHTHSVSGSTTSGEGAHSHGATNIYDPGHSHSFQGYDEEGGASGICGVGSGNPGKPESSRGSVENSGTGISITGGGTHTHTFSASTPGDGGTHTHDISLSIQADDGHTHRITGGGISGGNISGNTESAGVNNPTFTVNTVPAYYTVIYIIKVV